MVTFTVKDKLKTRLLIAESGTSLRQFAQKIGISHCYLSQILIGKKNPSPRVAHKIAAGLGQKIENIFLIELVDKSTCNKTFTTEGLERKKTMNG